MRIADVPLADGSTKPLRSRIWTTPRRTTQRQRRRCNPPRRKWKRLAQAQIQAAQAYCASREGNGGNRGIESGIYKADFAD